MSDRKNTGNLGEEIAAKFLENKGFFVIERNLRSKFGEIDIVAEKGENIHFIEVKTVSRENNQISRDWKPEDLIHPEKIEKIRKLAQFYLVSREISKSPQIDGVTVELDQTNKKARCTYFPNVNSS